MTGFVTVAFVSLVSFGIPETPEIPEVPELPDIDIPGIPVLEEVISELDGLSASLEGLKDLIPEVGVLDDVSSKLREMSDLDPEAASILEELEIYRAEIVEARDRLSASLAEIDSETAAIRDRVDGVREELRALTGE